MVRMSDVWDRASDVIARRSGILVSIALLFLWLPGLVRTVATVAVRGSATMASPGPATASPGGVLLLGLLGLAALVLALIGHLALVAVAGDPAIGRDAALRVARRRFWPYVGIMAIVIAALTILSLPLLIAVARVYPALAAMGAGGLPQVGSGTGWFVLVYSVALAVLVLWVEARLIVVLTPIVVNERLGLGSIARAWALTRGLTWRIVGVLLLFAVVSLVAVLAVQGAVGVTLRLLLGGSQVGLVLFLTMAAVSLVGCVIAVVVAAFSAQLYLAISGGRPRP
jgi:hypothetical protein